MLVLNRYKSIVVEEEPYLLELTRYIHLNPLRVGIVPSVKALDRYPWMGHSTVLGQVDRPWQSVNELLGSLAAKRSTARRRYQAFVADGVRRGRRPDLNGGGLLRSVGGWKAVANLRRGREGWAFDERILGSGRFVEGVLRQATLPPAMRDSVVMDRVVPALVERLRGIWGVSLAEIRSGNRRRPTAQARAAVAAVAVTGLGVPITRVACILGVGPPAICQAIERGLEALGSRSIDLDRMAKELVRKVK